MGKVLILMGSVSDSKTAEPCALLLKKLGVSYEARVTSAHRTPHRLASAASRAKNQGFGVIIGFAGGSAHLQGMASAETTLPVIGVAVPSKDNLINTLAAMLSQTQMPGGVPLLYAGSGEAGAKNASLAAAAILALADRELSERLGAWREKQTADIPADPLFEEAPALYEGEKK